MQRRLAISHETFAVLTLTMVLSAALVLGVSPAPAAAGILFCAFLSFLRISARPSIPPPALLVMFYLALHFASGLAFGGFRSLGTVSAFGWIANEGRVFLYYWPFLFAVLFIPRGSEKARRILRKALKVLTWLAFLNTLLGTVTGISNFGSHHAAGAFCAMLVIFHFHAWQLSRKQSDVLYLLVALAALLATDSRTSLGAAFVALLLFLLVTGRLTGLSRILVLVLPVVLLMPILFAEQFARLSDAANAETLSALSQNYLRTFATGGAELTEAWEARDFVGDQGNTNVAIRGYLWGRAVFEAAQSPLVGIGFGRFNDLGRDFEGVRYFAFPVVDANYPSASILTAHNTFLHVLTELGGVGLGLLLGLLWVLWRSIARGGGDALWQRVGLTNIICLCLMGVTQHSFGAPVYGLTLFALVGVSYRLSAAPPD